MNRFWSKVAKSEGCWNWTSTTNGRGYGTFRVGRVKVYAHRFAYETTVGPIKEGLVVDHLCRNPRCVNPAHLEPVTHLENVRRGLAPGHRLTRGERSGMAKLTDAQVEAIRTAYEHGRTQRALAAEYGVGKSQIGRITRGERRRWPTPAAGQTKRATSADLPIRKESA